MSELVASFDIGSNSVLMLVARRRDDGAWERVEEHAELTRISQGLDASGLLDDEAVERTARVLEEFRARADAIGVSRFVATGTAPFRRATNGREVARQLGRRIGVEIDVVSGEEEAELALAATRAAFPAADELLVVDIGGASTELIVSRGESASSARETAAAADTMISLDIGAVRLAERCLRDDPPGAHERSAVEQVVARELARPEVMALLDDAPPLVVGIAGTVTTLAALSIALEPYDADVIQGYELTADELRAVETYLYDTPLAERKKLPGLQPKRADVIPAGATLLRVLIERLGVSSIRVSDRGLRWGRLEGDG